MKAVVIGGGAAGFFAAITLAEDHPEIEVILLEKSDKLLAKVKVSGGGRCNVTHACFDKRVLAGFYPRGHKVLLGSFSQFQPLDTIQWFQDRGVLLKTEEDGRMFPDSNNSQTIVDCLLGAASNAGVKIWKKMTVNGIVKEGHLFSIHLEGHPELYCDKIVVATGGHPVEKSYVWLKATGHHIENPVPSLFTFNIPDKALHELAGVSLGHVKVKVAGTKLDQNGPMLITHWGLSGPVVLKLSAWGSRLLHDKKYTFDVLVNWLPDWNEAALFEKLNALKISESKKLMQTFSPFSMPLRLWKFLLERAGIFYDMRWSDLPKKMGHKLVEELLNSSFSVAGKTSFKEEFVTCGGIRLNEVNLKTMESELVPGLYFAGEVLDVDGLTGGFNFQNAWTSGWIAGKSVGEAIQVKTLVDKDFNIL